MSKTDESGNRGRRALFRDRAVVRGPGSPGKPARRPHFVGEATRHHCVVLNPWLLFLLLAFPLLPPPHGPGPCQPPTLSTHLGRALALCAPARAPVPRIPSSPTPLGRGGPSISPIWALGFLICIFGSLAEGLSLLTSEVLRGLSLKPKDPYFSRTPQPCHFLAA